MAARQRISRCLDVVGQLPGSIVYRGVNGWESITPTQPGAVLRVGDDGLPEFLYPPTMPGVDSGWQEATLQNGWTSSFAPSNKLKYRRLASEAVFIQALINPGTRTHGTLIATLAAGFAPSENTTLTLSQGTNVRSVQVNTDGTIKVNGTWATSGGCRLYISWIAN